MTERSHRLASLHLKNERTVWILEPLEKARPFDLLIFLDGEFYRDRIDAPSIVRDLQENGEMANSLVVFVSFESMETRARECPCHPPFADFVGGELLPWIWGRYPAAKSSPQRVLAGLSYTGLAASHVATVFPTAFTRILSQSGSYWWNDGWLVNQVGRMEGWIPPAFYLDVGLGETDEEVRHGADLVQEMSQIEGVRKFRDAVAAKGGLVRHVEFDGGHDFACWEKTLPDALRWALPAKKHA